MNKIASYLNEHLLGEVSGARALRKYYSTDASVLSITPEVVVFPRVTNDIRKVARFSWQLAEKGHIISITTRGFGNDTTGAAIGKGIVIETATHLNDIIHIVAKDRLVHAQPGIQLGSLSQALKWQGLAIPDVDHSRTLGGAIATDTLGSRASLGDRVEKLEVILANGDLIETGRLNRRDMNKKLGLQTFEGEIYRKLEGLIEDNQEIIQRISADQVRDNVGYKRLADVRQKDGSFDLTPLFIGSQGTLGIISEVVLRTDFFSEDESIIVITTDSLSSARDLSDKLQSLDPTSLHIYDGALYKQADAEGIRFPLLGDVSQLGALIYLRFADFSERAQAHKKKKVQKILKNLPVGMIDSTEHDREDFYRIRHVVRTFAQNDRDKSSLPLLHGTYIPSDRREEFEASIQELAKKHHLELPLTINVLTGTYAVITELKLDVVSDKQKLFRLITDYATLVDQCNGAVVSDGAEGRLKANAAWSTLDDDEVLLFEQLRQIFDPFGTLNPGVKQKNELRSLVSSLRSTYDALL